MAPERAYFYVSIRRPILTGDFVGLSLAEQIAQLEEAAPVGTYTREYPRRNVR
jgi:hypothetical protein